MSEEVEFEAPKEHLPRCHKTKYGDVARCTCGLDLPPEVPEPTEYEMTDEEIEQYMIPDLALPEPPEKIREDVENLRPYLNMCISSFVIDERERCAQIVESSAMCNCMKTDEDGGPHEWGCSLETIRKLAEQIRVDPEGVKEDGKS